MHDAASESLDRAGDISTRYLAARLGKNSRELPEFTLDELAPIMDFVNDKFTGAGASAILHVYNDIMQEFRTGHRCRVCGRTVKQNAAINYDCVREC